MDPDNMLSTFLVTQLHEGYNVNGYVGLPRDTYSVVKVQCSLGPDKTFSCTSGREYKHTEARLIDGVREYLKEREENGTMKSKPSLVITSYQNYSPCISSKGIYKGCANYLADFYTELKMKYDVTLEVIFVGSYIIRRPSCLYYGGTSNRPCIHGYIDTDINESKANVRGLQRLLESGVRVRTFEEQDWETLIDLLVELVKEREGRGMDDREREEKGDRCRERLQEKWKGFKDRRLKEDSYMKADCLDLGITLSSPDTSQACSPQAEQGSQEGEASRDLEAVAGPSGTSSRKRKRDEREDREEENELKEENTMKKKGKKMKDVKEDREVKKNRKEKEKKKREKKGRREEGEERKNRKLKRKTEEAIEGDEEKILQRKEKKKTQK